LPDILIRPLERSDRAEWRRLWTAYLEFYKATVSEDVYAMTWMRLFDGGEFEPKGFLALVGGKPAGLVHYLYHRSCWSLVNNCYLQDLFADPAVRGVGVGRALIEAVHAAAARIGVANVYWMTHETNEVGRRLYDRVGKRTGFIEYDMLP
jgi:GNAT superfamily N-acetyltransferase